MQKGSYAGSSEFVDNGCFSFFISRSSAFLGNVYKDFFNFLFTLKKNDSSGNFDISS